MHTRRVLRRLAAAPRWLLGLAIIGVFVAIALLPQGREGLFGRLEAIAYDARLATTLGKGGDPQVVIVDIDEASLRQQGRWPWSRDKVSLLTRQIFDKHQARAIAFDVVFAERDRSGGADVLIGLALDELRDVAGYKQAIDRLAPQLDFDAQLAKAFTARDVVLSFGFVADPIRVGALPPPSFTESQLMEQGAHIRIQPEAGYVANLATLQQAARAAGHFDPVFDADNVVRRVPMLKRYGDGYYPALTLAVLGVSVEAKAIKPIVDSNGDLEWLDVGGLRIPVAPDGTALVPYRGPRGTFKYISATEVMQDKVPADAFAGAIVLVGTSAKGLQDLRPTPVAPDYPGVEIHASLLTGMLNDEMLSAPPGANETLALAMVIGGLLALFALPYRRPVISTLGVLALIAVAIGGNLYLWHAWRLVYPLAPLLVLLVALGALNLLTGFVREANAIRQLSDMFGEYVPRERVEQMRESGERFSMQGESREMTVLFSDVRNFTALSENLTPAELSAMLNTYLTRITEIIHTHHGTIDKYIGDAVMAFWGAPLANARHAADALRASLAMNAVLPALRDEFVARGWPALSIGAGINSGTMNVGDMGSQFRKAYTVLGDAVNLASRLEGLTKVYGVPILIGEDTRIAAPEIVCREIDRVRVKGREAPVAIYQPLGETLTPAERDELDRYHSALALYRERKFDHACAAFKALAADRPELALYAIYAQRAAEFAAAAPPPDWDGATTFETK